MDVSGDVADLMVKESIQLTEASIKLLARRKRAITGHAVTPWQASHSRFAGAPGSYTVGRSDNRQRPR